MMAANCCGFTPADTGSGIKWFQETSAIMGLHISRFGQREGREMQDDPFENPFPQVIHSDAQ